MDCPTLDTGICPDCLSGQPDCEVGGGGGEGDTDGFLMVVGGLVEAEHSNSVEIITLDPESLPVPDCLQDLSPFPVAHFGAAGGVLSAEGDAPVVCGGSPDSPDPIYGCRKYDFGTDTWTNSSGLPHGPTYWAGSDYSKDWGLVVSGGTVLDDEGNFAYSNKTWRKD